MYYIKNFINIQFCCVSLNFKRVYTFIPEVKGKCIIDIISWQKQGFLKLSFSFGFFFSSNSIILRRLIVLTPRVGPFPGSSSPLPPKKNIKHIAKKEYKFSRSLWYTDILLKDTTNFTSDVNVNTCWSVSLKWKFCSLFILLATVFVTCQPEKKLKVIRMKQVVYIIVHIL